MLVAHWTDFGRDSDSKLKYGEGCRQASQAALATVLSVCLTPILKADYGKLFNKGLVTLMVEPRERRQTSTLIFSLTSNPSIRLSEDLPEHVKDRISKLEHSGRKPTLALSPGQIKNLSARKRVVLALPIGSTRAVVIELEPPSRAFIYFGVFLASLQFFDGALTSIGVSRFGVEREGNPLLRFLMGHYTPEQTLFFIKAFAIIVIAYLTVLAKKIRWIKDLIGVLCCIYLLAAIIPWLYILYLKQ